VVEGFDERGLALRAPAGGDSLANEGDLEDLVSTEDRVGGGDFASRTLRR
jgi:hypothetical protein